MLIFKILASKSDIFALGIINIASFRFSIEILDMDKKIVTIIKRFKSLLLLEFPRNSPPSKQQMPKKNNSSCFMMFD